ncbi:YhbD family protein [Clostridium tagluense]|uniref:YhbD family protein n=1 Tax=Clostridium tagluense TaxID=360422 RepID=UPI001CF26D6B|nr:YhbD family protein [Clostridium tagluense]MCB2310421.1 YhbD family protein [Clostridium tagluense]MCB2315413.1 YhbD family protein [Clostridium tagluense]MCB2320266.1 YhbD family protein [Clostridium tagluense]MCB2325155.1 YhbD family protein [Clostridium tagluense]MCB2330007.1 YhbD family protein [Clostridium tagluense]
MEEDLISKKELLEITKVSYGQLYRWKRKNLIPEDWFIKKSSYTGQETYFPRERILDRIEKIKDMKDDVSLDSLAQMFSPKFGEVFLSEEELLGKNIVSENTLILHKKTYGEIKIFSFERILYISLLEKSLLSGNVSMEEGKLIIVTLEENYKSLEGKNCEIVFLRKFGMALCFLITLPNELYIEKGAKIVLRLNISQCIQELKIKI